jgi:predicted GNAT superfamily acetyltransferase
MRLTHPCGVCDWSPGVRLRGAVVVGRDGAAASKDEQQDEQAQQGLGHAHGTTTGRRPAGTGVGVRVHGNRVWGCWGLRAKALGPHVCRALVNERRTRAWAARPGTSIRQVQGRAELTRADTGAPTAAAAAATRAGVRIEDLHDHAAMRPVSALLDRVWGRSEGASSIMAPEALTALAHAGGQVSAAYEQERQGQGQGRPVGASAAFVGLTEDGEVFLHSHVTGVLPGHGGRGIGRALKWHQRAWCLERGIDHVRWTFDPLVRRNAAFNLVVLGARAVAFREDVYGRMDDALNAGVPTDRLVVDWELTAARVGAAAAGRLAAPDLDGLRRAGARALLRVGDADEPVHDPADAPRLLVQVPADVEELRARDPDLAGAWGRAVRATLGDALSRGYHVTGFAPGGWYVLAADRAVHELAADRAVHELAADR